MSANVNSPAPMKMFSVKNFDRFQHYRDRAPPWIKLYNHLLEDYAFTKFPDASKWHLVAIWLLASRSGNRLPADPAWLATKIGANSEIDLTLFLSHKYIIICQDPPLTGAISYQDASNLLEREEERRAEESRGEQNNDRMVNVEFEDWYSLYPRKASRGQAIRAFRAARKKAPLEILMKGAQAYRDDPRRKPEYTKHPATWLNGECWKDDPIRGGTKRKTEQMPL